MLLLFGAKSARKNNKRRVQGPPNRPQVTAKCPRIASDATAGRRRPPERGRPDFFATSAARSLIEVIFCALLVFPSSVTACGECKALLARSLARGPPASYSLLLAQLNRDLASDGPLRIAGHGRQLNSHALRLVSVCKQATLALMRRTPWSAVIASFGGCRAI